MDRTVALQQLKSELLDGPEPHSLEAEAGVLGSLLIDPRVCDDVALVLDADDFYADANRRLYRHLIAMHDSGQPMDSLLLLDRLKTSAELEAVGGAAYLAEIVHAVPHSRNAMHYSSIVRQHSLRRVLIRCTVAAVQAAYVASEAPEAIIASLEASLSAIGATDAKPQIATAQEAVADAIAAIDAAHQRQDAGGYMSGLPVFDQSVGGFFRGELTILAARPGIGKTALAAQIAHHGGQRGRHTYFASLEMSGTELVIRVMCGMAGVSSQRIRTGELSQSDMSRLSDAGIELSRDALVMDTRPRLSVSDIAHAARRETRRGLALIVVDYLQRLTPADMRLKRYEQIGQMTRALKELARELNVPILCLCQLGRESEKETRPGLRHLRESGDIEADADNVLLIHRKPNESDATLIVAKARNGATGDVRLRWYSDRTLFECANPANYEPAFDDFGGD